MSAQCDRKESKHRTYNLYDLYGCGMGVGVQRRLRRQEIQYGGMN